MALPKTMSTKRYVHRDGFLGKFAGCEYVEVFSFDETNPDGGVVITAVWPDGRKLESPHSFSKRQVQVWVERGLWRAVA